MYAQMALIMSNKATHDTFNVFTVDIFEGDIVIWILYMFVYPWRWKCVCALDVFIDRDFTLYFRNSVCFHSADVKPMHVYDCYA